MFGRKAHKPRERFYLFPGQGGRNYWQKQRRLLIWAVVVATLLGGILAAGMWWYSKPHV